MHRQIFEYHPVIGYRFIPGIAARIPHEGGGYLVKTNQVGFRCEHEFTRRKSPGTFRVVLFGDSFTAGDGVSNRLRFGDLLEARFSSLEIFNFGLPGSGTDQQYLAFREFCAGLQYDLLMICPLVENIRRVVSRYRPVMTRDGKTQGYMAKPYLELVDGALQLRNVPVPKGIVDRDAIPPHDQAYIDEGGAHPTLRGLVNTYLRPFKDALQSAVGHQPVPEYDDADHPAWQLMKAILTQWIRETRAPVAICPLPLYQHLEGMAPPDGYQARFAELATIPAVTVWDPLPRLLAEPVEDRRRCRFSRDPHLTPYGHRLLAEALAPLVGRGAAVQPI